MIPCKQCGHVNPLGTLYCHQCGSPIQMDVSAIEHSVGETKDKYRRDQVFKAGRNAITVSGFLFLCAVVFSLSMVPDMPVRRFGYPPDLAPKDVFVAENALSVEGSGGPAPELPPPDQIAEGGAMINLMEWRRGEADFILGRFGVDLTQIGNWQIALMKAQNQETGLWDQDDKTGIRIPDPHVATGLALLALQAYPVLPEIQGRCELAWRAIKKKAVLGDPGMSKLGRALCLFALVDAGQLTKDEIRRAASRLSDGSQPDWQVLALSSFPPERRPYRLAALVRQVDAPIWQHLLQPFSDSEVLEGGEEGYDADLFSDAYLPSLDPLDRVAWSNAAWRLGLNPRLLDETLKKWSRADPPPRAPDDLREKAGRIADLSLVILACTPSLRAPVVWLAREP